MLILTTKGELEMTFEDLEKIYPPGFVELVTKTNIDYIETFGLDYNLNVCMEEPAELIQAISKCRRDFTPEAKDHLAEEISDTLIVICRLLTIYDIDTSSIIKWIIYKMDRGSKAIEEKKKNGEKE